MTLNPLSHTGQGSIEILIAHKKQKTQDDWQWGVATNYINFVNFLLRNISEVPGISNVINYLSIYLNFGPTHAEWKKNAYGL